MAPEKIGERFSCVFGAIFPRSKYFLGRNPIETRDFAASLIRVCVR
jgi:hypothetical protein